MSNDQTPGEPRQTPIPPPPSGAAPVYEPSSGASAAPQPSYGTAAPGGYGQPGTGGGYGSTPQPAQGNGLAIAALVLGILALLGSWIPIINIGSLLLGLVAVILAVVALRRKAGGRGLSLGGLITGGLAIVVSGVVLAVSIAALSSIDTEDLQQQIEDAASSAAAEPQP